MSYFSIVNHTSQQPNFIDRLKTVKSESFVVKEKILLVRAVKLYKSNKFGIEVLCILECGKRFHQFSYLCPYIQIQFAKPIKLKFFMAKKNIVPLVKGKPPKIAPVQKKVNYYWMIIICIVLTFIAFAPVFKAGFVNWDDPDYVTSNQNIKSLSNFYKIVTTPVQGNYHPLTMLSLALNYAISGKSATSYHVVNLLLHVLNVILVFFFVLKLSGKKHWIAFIAALLFGIHPLHVESVAWIAERKDVLYAFFFIAGLIRYLKYIEKPGIINFLAVLVLFLLSLLSKPAAIIFPVVLLAIDYYYDRLGNSKTYLEKVPFLLISLIFGILTLSGQTAQGAVSSASTFPSHFRYFYGFYGIMMYIYKALLPINLCAFYPYPAINRFLPLEYYLSPILTLVIAIIFFAIFRKNRLLAFGIAFYYINLLLVLQFIPVGSAIIADRYTYIPLIGLLIIVGFYFQKWVDKNSGIPSPMAIAVLLLSTVSLTYLSYKQASTWKDNASLWDHAIAIKPSSKALSNRALTYKLEKQNAKAIELFSRAISINKAEKDALVNRGNIYFNEKKYDLAINDYNQCLAIDPNDKLAIENRGTAYAAIGKYDMALTDMNQSLKLNPGSINGYANRAIIKQALNQNQEAIDDFYLHMKNSPDENGNIWNSIGILEQKLDQNVKAIECFDKAIALNENQQFLYNRALSQLKLGNKQKARIDIQRAIELGAKFDPAFLKKIE